MKTKNIRQSIKIKASPHTVYEALMDSKKHSKFTGAEAKISRKVGGKFTAYGGSLEGINLELIPDKKIVQSWRADDWPAGHYSRVTFSLKAEEDGTRLNFTQTVIPEEHYEDIKQGWRDYYWQPLKRTLPASPDPKLLRRSERIQSD